MTPWELLATYAAGVVPSGVSVYDSATATPTPPCVVIRPDQPWREPAAYCFDLQHYVAVAVVAAATPDDGTALMYEIHSALLSALPEGWGFVSVSAPLIDESTSSSLLASALRLSYRNGDTP